MSDRLGPRNEDAGVSGAGRRALRFAAAALKFIGLSLLVLIAAGVVYERVGIWQDESLRPPSNEFVVAGGRRVHVACVGSGPRTFVLDAGASAWSVFWWRIQPALARVGRTCAFDRPGYGWSDPIEGAHDGVAAAGRLHDLVRQAHIQTPFIYVGHSLGANFAQVYWRLYPRDVSGLVLLEPGDPKDLLEDTHATAPEIMHASECSALCVLADASGQLGVIRLLAHGESFAGAAQQQYRAGASRPSMLSTILREQGSLPKTALETRDVGSFDNTPVLVFASSNPREPEAAETEDDVRRWQIGQRQYLASLSARSTRGAGLAVVPNATHITMVLGQAQAEFIAQRIIAFAGAIEPQSMAEEARTRPP